MSEGISDLKVERYPIMITYNTIALLTLYHHNTNTFQDLWAMDYDDPMLISKNAAKQFVERLEDHWNAIFLMDLRDEINATLKKNDDEYGTKFALEYIKSDSESPD